MTDIAKDTPPSAVQATNVEQNKPKSLPNLATNDDEQMGMESILPVKESKANGGPMQVHPSEKLKANMPMSRN